MERGQVKETILKALESGEKYGWEIIKEVEKISNGKIVLKQPSLYSALTRLENAGSVTSYWVDSTIGGKRHYYKLTNKEIANNCEKTVDKTNDVCEIVKEVQKPLNANKDKFFGIKVQENQQDIFSLVENEKVDNEDKPKIEQKIALSEQNENKVNEQKSNINNQLSTVESNDFDNIFETITTSQKSFAQREHSPVKKLVPSNNIDETDLLYGNFELKNELEETFKDFDFNEQTETKKTDDIKEIVASQQNNVDLKNIFKEFLNNDERIEENPLHDDCIIKPQVIEKEIVEEPSPFIQQPVDMEKLNNVNISLNAKPKQESFYEKVSATKKFSNEEIPTLNSSLKFQASKKVENKLKGLILRENKRIENIKHKSKLYDNYKNNILSLTFTFIICALGLLTLFLISKKSNEIFVHSIILVSTYVALLIFNYVWSKKKYYGKYNFKSKFVVCLILFAVVLATQILIFYAKGYDFVNFSENVNKIFAPIILELGIILLPVFKLAFSKLISIKN